MTLLAAVWGLVATAGCLFAEPMLRGMQLPRFGGTLAIAALYVLPVCCWSLVVVWAYAAFARRKPPPGLVSIAINSGQCLPAILFFSIATPPAIAAVLALGVNAAYVLAFLIADPDDRPDRRTLAFFVALGFQAALCLRLLHEQMLAALGTAVGVVATLALLRSSGWHLPSARTSWRNSIASVAVAILLASWMAFTGRMPMVAAAPVAKPAPRTGVGNSDTGDAAPMETIAVSALPGVILWPEVRNTTTLVAPLPVWNALTTGQLLSDVSIPFSGEYWIFEPPHRRPPPTSVLRRGTPLKLAFHTIDGNSLMMEAHQKLPVTVAMACCRAIEAQVRNEDTHRGVLLLELILVNGARSVSLGTVPVLGGRLVFPMPKSPPFAGFDEIGIVYHREPMPIGASARLAIERFVLVR